MNGRLAVSACQSISRLSAAFFRFGSLLCEYYVAS
jgi:hypothetical protein